MPWLPKNKILVPVDFSKASLAALDVALELTAGPAQVHVVHVLPHLSSMDLGVMFGNVTDESRIAKAKVAIEKKLADSGHDGLPVHVRIGSPPKEIVATADEIEAELIVLPPRGHNELAAFHIGSTAGRVVHLSHCPVLVVKGLNED